MFANSPDHCLYFAVRYPKSPRGLGVSVLFNLTCYSPIIVAYRVHHAWMHLTSGLILLHEVIKRRIAHEPFDYRCLYVLWIVPIWSSYTS